MVVARPIHPHRLRELAMLQAFVYFSALSLERYVVFVALAFAAVWWLQRPPARRPLLQPDSPARGQVRREVWLSAATILMGGAVAPLIIAMGWNAKLLFYPRIDDHGWAYFAFSIVLMMLVRDALFYAFHRAMHHHRVFRFAHRAHHLSTRPDPWTAYAVHPLESLLDVVVTFVVILFFVPKHPLAYLIFLWIDAAYAVYGHMGVEIYPRGFSRHWLGRWINTSVAHNHHHASARHNYGYYFLIWDRLLGSIDPDYDRRYDAATPPGVV
jgi:sterol desaturase/sphingolipid hydroxylase (fatty acid hydroxylase superfamily)